MSQCPDDLHWPPHNGEPTIIEARETLGYLRGTLHGFSEAAVAAVERSMVAMARKVVAANLLRTRNRDATLKLGLTAMTELAENQGTISNLRERLAEAESELTTLAVWSDAFRKLPEDARGWLSAAGEVVMETRQKMREGVAEAKRLLQAAVAEAEFEREKALKIARQADTEFAVSEGIANNLDSRRRVAEAEVRALKERLATAEADVTAARLEVESLKAQLAAAKGGQTP